MINSKLDNAYIIWLFFTAFMIVIMVIIGGITRLTDSGLSMIDWHIVDGIFPPLTNQEWIAEFEKYKQYPEFKLINFDMNLSDFKKIFFWEYVHRIWGRLIGIVFIVPLIFFLFKKAISRNSIKYLLLVLVLGICQAFMGWFMVESGLVKDPNVSQYRLAMHLILAFIIYSLLLFQAWNKFRVKSVNLNTTNQKNYESLLKYLLICLFLVLTTIVSGAFVAGTNAGLAYNNFPFMGDSILPPDPFILEPWWKNFFENISLIQFDHRVLSTLSLLVISLTWFLNIKKGFKSMINHLLNFGFSILILQYIIGITILKLHVPVSLGVIHQLGSLILLSTLIILLSEIFTEKKGEI